MIESNYHFTPLKGYENFEATTQIIIAEILKRNLPLEIIDADNNLISVKYKGREFVIHEGTVSDANSLISYKISDDKWMTKLFLKREGISCAKGVLLKRGYLKKQINGIEYPVVVKPLDTDHGIGVQTDIGEESDLIKAVDYALNFSKGVIVEQYCEGREYRFMVIDSKVRAVAYRLPANVCGDGIKTVEQLVDIKNRGRGADYRHPLLKIVIDDEVKRHLAQQGYTPLSVPYKGETLYLRKNSNLSTGGDSVDVTDDINSFYCDVAVRAAKSAGLRIAGVDIIIKDEKSIPCDDNYIVIELNAPAMLSMHNYPYFGKNRNIGKYVLDTILSSKKV
ncbi:glutamate ligase [Marinilabiliaceae bacterium ANBcel2]|nr:glutamate ligase [Marinilabiliaceae bacterium ANBcel2]